MGRYSQSWAFDFFVGIFSGWRMGDVGGKGRVEPGEDLRRFENKGGKKFSKYRILRM